MNRKNLFHAVNGSMWTEYKLRANKQQNAGDLRWNSEPGDDIARIYLMLIQMEM